MSNYNNYPASAPPAQNPGGYAPPAPSQGSYAPPQYGYTAQQGQGQPNAAPPNYGSHYGAPQATAAQPILVSPQPMVMAVRPMMLPSQPCSLVCPNCRQQIITRTVQRDGLLVWGSCAVLALLGCIFGCCLIPFCVPECKDVEHYCSNCNVLLGERRPL